jgi:hypothetical protein
VNDDNSQRLATTLLPETATVSYVWFRTNHASAAAPATDFRAPSPAPCSHGNASNGGLVAPRVSTADSVQTLARRTVIGRESGTGVDGCVGALRRIAPLTADRGLCRSEGGVRCHPRRRMGSAVLQAARRWPYRRGGPCGYRPLPPVATRTRSGTADAVRLGALLPRRFGRVAAVKAVLAGSGVAARRERRRQVDYLSGHPR